MMPSPLLRLVARSAQRGGRPGAASCASRPAHAATPQARTAACYAAVACAPHTLYHSPRSTTAAAWRAKLPIARRLSPSPSSLRSLHGGCSGDPSSKQGQEDTRNASGCGRQRQVVNIAATVAAIGLLLLTLYAPSGTGAAILAEMLPSEQQPQSFFELETESASESGSFYPGSTPVPFQQAHLQPVGAEQLTYVDPRPFRHMHLSALLSRYAVFVMCCFPRLVECAPGLLDWTLDGAGSRVPGVKRATEAVVRATFFKQFVGAESAQECIPLLAQLSRDNLAALFAFSVEMIETKGGGTANLEHMPPQSAGTAAAAERLSGGEGGGGDSKYIYDSIIDALIESVDVAAAFAARPAWADCTSDDERALLASRPPRDGSTMVAIKLSGVLKDPSVLERASAAIVPREHFSAPPQPLPPPAAAASGGGALAIPIAALQHKHPADVAALKELWAGLRRLALRAQRADNVRLVVDAEYSWFQPAIDAMYEALAAEFNRLPPPATGAEAWYKRAWGRALFGHDGGAAGTAVPGQVRGPLVFNTFQAYLRRTPSHLAASLERARAGGYTLGVKLVRGAYVEQENAQWATKDVSPPPPSTQAERDVGFAATAHEWHSPVWRSKTLTDRCYDGCAVRLVEEVAMDMRKPGASTDADAAWPRLSVIFATHNWQSAMKITRRMLESGLVQPPTPETLLGKELEVAAASNASALANANAGASANAVKPELVLLQVAPGVRGRICFGQLLGMADSLTRRLQLAFDPVSGGAGPHMVLKYIPYGSLSLVIPYLTRRAIENKSVMQGSGEQAGAAAYERKLAGKEIRRRLLPFLP